MLDWYKKIKKQRQEEEETKKLLLELKQEKNRYHKIKEFTELRKICIDNVRYIKSYLNTLYSVVNCMKGNSMAETKRKRASARKRIKWLESKLIEEKGMLIHWESQMRKVK
jgi:hypothetical protein